jgi:hypothetical protein
LYYSHLPRTSLYSIIIPQELGWSEEQHFTSPPAVGPDSSVRLLAVADLGQAEVDGSMEASEMLASLATTARLAAEVDAGAQLLIHNGDISCERVLPPLLLAAAAANVWLSLLDSGLHGRQLPPTSHLGALAWHRRLPQGCCQWHTLLLLLAAAAVLTELGAH